MTAYENSAAQDVLTELVNIGAGRAGAALSELVGERVDLTIPTVRLCSAQAMSLQDLDLFQTNCTVVTQDFAGPIRGRAVLAFPPPSDRILASLLCGLTTMPDELDVEMSGVLLEVGNIVLNAVLGSLSNAISSNLMYSVPDVMRYDHPVLRAPREESGELLVADVKFSVAERKLCGSVVIVFAGGAVNELVRGALMAA